MLTTWSGFYRRCVKDSFSGARGIAEGVAGLLAIAGGAYAHFNPTESDLVNDMLWIVPLTLFAGIFLGSFVLAAPYGVYRELELAKNGLNARIQELEEMPRLRIVHDPNKHFQANDYPKLKKGMLYRVAVECDRPYHRRIEDVGVTVVSLESLDASDDELNDYCRRLTQTPLSRRHGRPGQRGGSTVMDSGQPVEFDVVEEIDELRKWQLCHRIEGNKLSCGLPPRRFRITLRAHGENCRESEDATFEFYADDNHRLVFDPVE
jgi:hypothetical protein